MIFKDGKYLGLILEWEYLNMDIIYQAFFFVVKWGGECYPLSVNKQGFWWMRYSKKDRLP